MSEDIFKILSYKEVKPTPNRILVLKELVKATRPLSLSDLEVALDPMDKASIYRVLDILAEKDIIHVIEDGSRSVKYEACLNRNGHDINDHHVHFYCDCCKKTFCFETIKVPEITVPEGFEARSVNYVLKGLCPDCRNKS